MRQRDSDTAIAALVARYSVAAEGTIVAFGSSLSGDHVRSLNWDGTSCAEIEATARIGAFVVEDAHLIPNARLLFEALHDVARRNGHVPLVVTAPNARHPRRVLALLRDGLTDFAGAGLGAKQLDDSLLAAGWGLAQDADIADTDGSARTPINALLARLGDAGTDRFVRCYLPRSSAAPTNTESTVALSVLVRSGARLELLPETLLMLVAQTNSAFEVVVVADDRAQARTIAEMIEALPTGVGPEMRVVTCAADSDAEAFNSAVPQCRGRYVTFLTTGAALLGQWAEVFLDGIEIAHDRAVRAQTIVHPGRYDAHNPGRGYEVTGHGVMAIDDGFVLADHLDSHATPLAAMCIPRSAFTDLGLKFRAAAGVWADRLLAIEVGLTCGFVTVPDFTSTFRLGLHPAETRGALPADALAQVGIAVIGGADLAMPRRESAPPEIPHEVHISDDERVAALENEVAALRGALDEVLESKSWKLTRPLRHATETVRARRSRSGSAGGR